MSGRVLAQPSPAQRAPRPRALKQRAGAARLVITPGVSAPSGGTAHVFDRLVAPVWAATRRECRPWNDARSQSRSPRCVAAKPRIRLLGQGAQISSDGRTKRSEAIEDGGVALQGPSASARARGCPCGPATARTFRHFRPPFPPLSNISAEAPLVAIPHTPASGFEGQVSLAATIASPGTLSRRSRNKERRQTTRLADHTPAAPRGDRTIRPSGQPA
jgi:hypothetical protein